MSILKVRNKETGRWESIRTIKGDKGETGKSLRVLENGNIAEWDPETGRMVDTGMPAAATVNMEDIPIGFEEAAERVLPASGETIPTVFGKVVRWLRGLGKFAFAATIDWNADVSNKPEITSRQYIDDADAALSGRITGEATRATGAETALGRRIDATDASLDEVREIAEGAAKGIVFATKAQMDNWLDGRYVRPDGLKPADLVVGQHLLIEELGVPDFWWNGSAVRELETQKVELSDYPTRQELTNALATSLANYVRTVEGKGLSTEDFTTALKSKLAGLSNYDDAAIRQAIDAIDARLDTLVGGSAGAAIDSFREIEAFLQGITDTQTLTGLLNDLKAQIVDLIPANTVQDATYVHTDNNFTDAEKSKLEAVAVIPGQYAIALPPMALSMYGKQRVTIELPRPNLTFAVKTTLAPNGRNVAMITGQFIEKTHLAMCISDQMRVVATTVNTFLSLADAVPEEPQFDLVYIADAVWLDSTHVAIDFVLRYDMSLFYGAASLAVYLPPDTVAPPIVTTQILTSTYAEQIKSNKDEITKPKP